MRLFGLLGTLLIAGVAGIIGYNWGYSDGLTHTVANGANVVVTRGFGWGGGFVGLIFGLFLLFLIFGLIRRAIFGWGGPGRYGMNGYGRGWGHGHWHGYATSGSGQPGSDRTPGVPPFFDGMLKDWHRQAHDQPSKSEDASTPPSGGSSPA